MSTRVLYVRCRVCDFCESVIRAGSFERDEDTADHTSDATIPHTKKLLGQDLCEHCYAVAKDQLK